VAPRWPYERQSSYDNGQEKYKTPHAHHSPPTREDVGE
jgi:hypothetical protein